MKTKKQTTTESKHDERDEAFIRVLRSGADKLDKILFSRRVMQDGQISLGDSIDTDAEFLETVQLLEHVVSLEKKQIEDMIKSREVPTIKGI